MPESKPIAVLSIVRYPIWAVPFAIFSMAIFRLPLWLSKKISFYKLMGSGRNGTFDKTPDWRQWAVLTVSDGGWRMADSGFSQSNLHDSKVVGLSLDKQIISPSSAIHHLPSFLKNYWKLFCCTVTTYILEPVEGHGLWDGKKIFGDLPKQKDFNGQIAVLTRATIHFSRLKNFWANVDGVAQQMKNAEGFITSYGIGEIPLIKQATFSIWENKQAMQNFAYKMRAHAEVVQKTRKENWYSEEMFVRFKILAIIKY